MAMKYITLLKELLYLYLARLQLTNINGYEIYYITERTAILTDKKDMHSVIFKI